MKKVGIIGAGNGGQGLAGYFNLKGYEVRLYDYLEETVAALQEKTITLEGACEGTGQLNIVSHNIEEVVEDTDLIMIVNPTIYHKRIAMELAPYLKDGDMIFLHPSSVFGAFAFKNALEEGGCSKEVTIAESNTLLLACRILEPGRILITGKKDRLLVSAFPATENNRLYELIKDAIPEVEICESVLVTSFDSTNAMVHPFPTIMNVSWVESGEKFKFYYEGIGPTVGNFLSKLDQERMVIGKTLGLIPGENLFSLEMEYEAEYRSTGKDLVEIFRNVKAYDQIYTGPSVRTRYILEDIPNGMVPFMEMGRLVNCPVDNMKLTIDLCEALLEEDLSSDEKARTLKNLGLEGMTVEEIKEYAKTGKKS
ncbi:MAG: NAD/NADP octopine/nopaline dehydrogenase family protein [Tissierellia bacterium]|nr:NAD/NADP octopine/nopaline dehydrogenase family protein [Tissierellia bacterium]